MCPVRPCGSAWHTPRRWNREMGSRSEHTTPPPPQHCSRCPQRARHGTLPHQVAQSLARKGVSSSSLARPTMVSKTPPAYFPDPKASCNLACCLEGALRTAQCCSEVLGAAGEEGLSSLPMEESTLMSGLHHGRGREQRSGTQIQPKEV